MNQAVKVIDIICVGGKTPNRDNILRYERIAEQFPQIEIPVKHYIHGGMYAREITIPKDTILTGQIYKFDHLDIMICGDITVSTDTGETKRFAGYNCFEGLSGKKRAGYAHEDTTWITIHPFTGVDGDEIQKAITAETFEELEGFNLAANQLDYKVMIDGSGMTEKEVRNQVESVDDVISIITDADNLAVSESRIEGVGLFSSVNIHAEKIILPSRIDGKRTEAGRYTNHAVNPNAKMVFDGDNMNLVSIREIEGGEEITVNYRSVIKHRAERGDLLCQE